MTPLLKDIIMLLDEIAPFSTAEDWDNPGLQVGFPSDEIKKALISLDPAIDALKKAKDVNAQLLLTHHPLIFNRLSNINSAVYPGDVISEALQSRISIVAFHTNLDAAKGGINDILAGIIGIQNIGPLIKNPASDDALDGMGRIGDLADAMPLSTVVRMLMDALGLQGAMVLGAQDKMIKKVAVLGGAGGEEMLRAAEQGADLYITGDIRHHEALIARRLGLALIDGGHFHMEKAAMNLFASKLRDKFNDLGWDLVVEIYEDETAPMQYHGRETDDKCSLF
jgi:GTP cyclohydrolase I